MRHTEFQEARPTAAELADYTGWSLQGVEASDGTRLWGELTAARPIAINAGTPQERTVMCVTYSRYDSRSQTHMLTEQILELTAPTVTGRTDNRVTLGRSVEISSAEAEARHASRNNLPEPVAADADGDPHTVTVSPRYPAGATLTASVTGESHVTVALDPEGARAVRDALTTELEGPDYAQRAAAYHARYAALDATVEAITAGLPEEAIHMRSDYETGGHVAVANWYLPETTEHPHGLMLTVILGDTLEGCEFYAQPLAAPLKGGTMWDVAALYTREP